MHKCEANALYIVPKNKIKSIFCVSPVDKWVILYYTVSTPVWVFYYVNKIIYTSTGELLCTQSSNVTERLQTLI